MPYQDPKGLNPPLEIDLFETDPITGRFVIRITTASFRQNDDHTCQAIEKQDVTIKKDDVFIIDFERFIQTAFALCYQNAYRRLGHTLIKMGQRLIEENPEIKPEVERLR